jgi:ribonuclease R
MREAVIELLREKRGQSLNARQIAHHLNLTSPNHKLLRAEIRALVREGKIIEGRDQRYAARDENRVLKGAVRLHADGFGFLIPEDKTKADVFIPARALNFAMNGDAVLVESFAGRDGRYEGRVIQVVTRANQTVVGTLKKMGDQYFVAFRDVRLGIDEIYIPKKNLGKAAVGDFVAVKIVQYPGHGIMAIGEIANVIGVEIDEKSLKEAALIQRGIARKFPDAVHHDVQRLPAEIEDVLPHGRTDLRDLPIITIDGVTAKDFDDAVYAERRGRGTVLWVSIADVAEYVPVGSALDKEAYRRGTSTYLPDECVPMLPEKLSNGLCSLNPGVPRLTLTAEIHYNAEAEFTHALYYKSVIRSAKRATYDEVQAYYDGTAPGAFTAEVAKSLDVMRGLAEALMKKSEARGTMGFDLPEAEFVFDGQGRVVRVRKRQRFFSHKLIEQFMIAANVAVAQYFTTRNMPLLYRIHEEPDRIKVQTFLHMIGDIGLGRFVHGFHPADFFRAISGNRLEAFLQSVFLRSLKQAVYSPDNAGHYGLALSDYAHFTSPIRRYPDLTVHRQLRSVISQAPGGAVRLDRAELKKEPRTAPIKTCYSYPDLVTIGNAASKRERDAMEAEREVSDIKRAFFMKGHLHEKFNGIVTRINKFGLNVELDPHFVEGFLPIAAMKDDYYAFEEKKLRYFGRRTKRAISIGDRLLVEVAEIDSQTSRINLGLVASGAPAPGKPAKHGKSGKPAKHKKHRKK